MNMYSNSREEMTRHLETSLTVGLTEEEAALRQAEYGENRLKEKKKKTTFQRFLDQFKDVMIIILILAAVISFVIACFENEPMEFLEPALILFIVILNAM